MLLVWATGAQRMPHPAADHHLASREGLYGSGARDETNMQNTAKSSESAAGSLKYAT